MDEDTCSAPSTEPFATSIAPNITMVIDGTSLQDSTLLQAMQNGLSTQGSQVVLHHVEHQTQQFDAVLANTMVLDPPHADAAPPHVPIVSNAPIHPKSSLLQALQQCIPTRQLQQMNMV